MTYTSTKCGECDGHGWIEIQTSVDTFDERVCEDCWGEGKLIEKLPNEES